MMFSYRKKYLIVLLCFYLIILFIIYAFLFGVVALNPNNIVNAKGKIVDNVENRYIIKYTENEKDHYYTYGFLKENAPKIGDEIEIIYNKNNPEKVKLSSENSVRTGMWIFVILIILIPTLCLTYNYYSYTVLLPKKGKKIVAKYIEITKAINGSSMQTIYKFGLEDKDKTIFFTDTFEDDYYDEVLKDSKIEDVSCFIRNMKNSKCNADFVNTLAEKNIVVCVSDRIL